jgi:hypothetical protein
MTNEILDRAERSVEGGMLVELVRKYALWLGVFLVLETVFRMATSPLLIYLQNYVGFEPLDTRIYTVFFSLPIYLCNIITAVMIHQDMRKTNTVSTPVIILTLLFNEIGVCFFLLPVLYKELMNVIQSPSQGPDRK